MGLLGGACGFDWASRDEWREVHAASRVSGRGKSVVGARGATAFGRGSIVRFGRQLGWQADWGLGVAVLVEPVLARRGDDLRRSLRRVLGRCELNRSRSHVWLRGFRK